MKNPAFFTVVELTPCTLLQGQGEIDEKNHHRGMSYVMMAVDIGLTRKNEENLP
jgi:hypothetical protein